MGRRAIPVWIVLLGVVLVWGSAFSGVKVLLRKLDPYALTTSRLFMAAVCYTVLLPLVRAKPPVRAQGDAIRLVSLGVLGAAGYHLAVNWGERFISAGLTSLITASVPAIVAVFAAIVLREHLGRRGALGTAVALGGIGILTAAGEGGFSAQSTTGALVTLLAPISWATYTIISKPLAARYDGVRLNLMGAWCGAVVTLPFGLVHLRDLGRLDAGDWAWMVYLSAMSTAGAYTAYAWALRHWSASRVAAFIYLVPPTSLLWAWVVLGEVPSLWAIAGGVVVIGGVALVESSRAAARAPQPASAERG